LAVLVGPTVVVGTAVVVAGFSAKVVDPAVVNVSSAVSSCWTCHCSWSFRSRSCWSCSC
ncbi:unnamed protein product, partial [Gadus morhua 'NCC']